MALALGYAAAGFLLAGFSEVLSPLFGLGLLVLWLHHRQRRYIAAGLGLAIGLLVVFSAPGNAIRVAALPPRQDFFSAVLSVIPLTGEFLFNSAVKHAGGVLLVFLIGSICPLKVPLGDQRSAAKRIILVTLCLIVFTLFVPLYALGSLDTRHYTFAAFILCIGLFLLGGLCADSRLFSSL